MRKPHLPVSAKQLSVDALAVAAMSAEGKTQTTIAAALDLSQTAVSRLLKSAKDFVETERRFRWDELDEATQQKVRRRMSHRLIEDQIACFARLNGQLNPVIHIVTIDEQSELGNQFETFAAQAAVILRSLLEAVRGNVGVAWGSTLWHTTQALRSILPQRPFRGRAPIGFFPLCGDPLIDSEERYADRTSSRIVSELNKAVNGDERRPPWLGLVPAFIPRTFKGDSIDVINQLIDLVPQYGRIFGPRIPSGPTAPPIAGDLHMIVTAAGPAKSPLGFGRNPLLGLSDDESKLLAKNIFGDIGGVLLPRLSGQSAKKGVPPAPHSLVQELTKRWTGLRIEHLKACASRAFEVESGSRPGLTLLSFGPSHVEIVLEAIRQGLVNQLIIGSDLENAISEVLVQVLSESKGSSI